MSKVPFEIEKLKESSRTVTSIKDVMLHCWNYDVYEISSGMLIVIQENEHGSVELIFVSKSKWDAISCLIWSVNCGGGKS